MGRTDWLPAALVDKAGVFRNIDAKIDGYAAVLGLSAGVVADIHRVCAQFGTAYRYIEQCNATMQSAYSWRDHIFSGSPQGSAAPAPPIFPTLTPTAGDKVGIIEEMRSLREMIKAAPGYTTAVGSDLSILAGSRTKIDLHDRTPTLKVTTRTGYKIAINGRMHGINALRVEYQRNGADDWVLAGFLTYLPAEITITPETDGMPESGRIRARYFHKNQAVGKFSAESAVTVSA